MAYNCAPAAWNNDLSPKLALAFNDFDFNKRSFTHHSNLTEGKHS